MAKSKHLCFALIRPIASGRNHLATTKLNAGGGCRVGGMARATACGINAGASPTVLHDPPEWVDSNHQPLPHKGSALPEPRNGGYCWSYIPCARFTSGLDGAAQRGVLRLPAL